MRPQARVLVEVAEGRPGIYVRGRPMPETLRFGPFELDVGTCELRRGGRRVHLALQPARVLCLLAERHGRLVTRDEVREYVWGPDIHVDTDLGLAYCLNEIRSAL